MSKPVLWEKYETITFVCVEVLWPSQPNGVMSSMVSLPNHTFTGQASSKRLTSIVHILSPETDNCPLNQPKGENDHRKYFMINLHKRILPTSVGVDPVTSWSPVRRRIQLSHRGRLKITSICHLLNLPRDW